jgi:lysophospholipase L1-like esterase
MKKGYIIMLLSLLPLFGLSSNLYASKFVPANDSKIQYFGRWDMSDPLHPKHSWPGVYLIVKFSGTSIGIRTNDTANYFNVYIDGKFNSIFHGSQASETDYILATNLKKGNHLLRLSKRNFAFNTPFNTFSGLLLDENGKLLTPPARPTRKIEFIGDSFTAAEGNEVTQPGMKWEDKFPLTNIDKGFAGLVGNHYQSDYHTICRSGSGLVCDWQANYELTIPKRWDRTLMESNDPKWDFNQWKPDLVVLCLGLNDSSGMKEPDGKISDEKSAEFRNGYKAFIAIIQKDYTGTKILCVAALGDWLKNNVKQIVEEEKADGATDIYYTQFDWVEGVYIDGHPTVAGHQQIAEQIIKAIDSYNLFPKQK